MKKNIWIINHHANGMYFDEGGRHYSIAKYLKRKGYDPVIFCANAIHGRGGYYFENLKLWQEHVAEKIGVQFVFIKCRKYSDNGKDRILGMLDFYFNMKKTADEYLLKHKKPDIIIGSSVHPLACVAGIKLARKLEIPCIVEIRDLWPESIVAYNVATSGNVLIKVLYRLERWIYTKADVLIFTMGGGMEYIKEKKWDIDNGGKIDINKIHYINNGVDLENFDKNKRKYQISDEDLENKEITKIVYVGSIRHANNVGALLDIAKEVDPSIKFLIWGNGDEMDILKERVVKEYINNVVFKGKIDKKYIPYIVTKADINIMDLQKTNKILKFGISPNKLFDYFAAKKPFVMYQLNNYNPATEFDVGLVANDYSEIVDYLNDFKDLKKEQTNDLKYEAARQAFSYERLTNKLIKIIESV